MSVAAFIVASVALVGCSPAGPADPTQPSSSASPPSSPSASTVDSSSAPSASASPTQTPAPSGTIILPPGADPDATDGPVTPAPQPSQSADIGESIAFGTGIEIHIDQVEAFEVTAHTPGEVSGTAVVVTVTAQNSSTEQQSLDSAVVTLVAGDGTVGIGTTAGDPAPFSGSVDPGASAEARYVFMLDDAAQRRVVVTVNYAAGEPVAVFTGEVS